MKSFRLLLMALSVVFVLPACQSEVREVIAELDPPRAHVAVLVAEGFHDGEAFMPIGYLVNRGVKITVIGSERGTVKAYNSDFTIQIEKAISEVNVDDFDGLILPGGRGPAVLREDPAVVQFAKEFFESGKVTAAICHGPQVLVTADVMAGKTSTGIGGIQEEIEGAGATYVDQSVVIDGNLITSRLPHDLNDFSSAIFNAL